MRQTLSEQDSTDLRESLLEVVSLMPHTFPFRSAATISLLVPVTEAPAESDELRANECCVACSAGHSTGVAKIGASKAMLVRQRNRRNAFVSSADAVFAHVGMLDLTSVWPL